MHAQWRQSTSGEYGDIVSVLLQRLRYARKSLERTRAYDTFLWLKVVVLRTLGHSVSPLEGMSLWGEEKDPPTSLLAPFFI